MIDEPKLFIRKNNRFHSPSKDWTINSKIYVSGSMNLGFNDKIIFDQDNSPSLRKVIRMIQAVRNQAKGREFVFEGKGKRVKLKVCTPHEIKIYQLWHDERLIVHKVGNFIESVEVLCNHIYSQLEPLNRNMRHYYFNFIRPISPNYTSRYSFKFKKGDKVKTIVSESLKRYREGMIFSNQYHNKDGVIYYHIFTEGRIHNRKYKESELVLNEDTSYSLFDSTILDTNDLKFITDSKIKNILDWFKKKRKS